MTQDEIIRMAREAGIIFEPMTIDGIEYEYRYVRCSDSIGEDEADCIERFAALVAAHERNRIFDESKHIIKRAEARGAIFEREKQAEQEPVGYVYMKDFLNVSTKDVALTKDIPVGTKLYAAPVRTKDLTDDEIEECVHIADSECTEDACMPWFVEFARAVIAADREKNK